MNGQGEPMRDLREVKADAVALVDVRRRAHRAGFHYQKAHSDCPLCYIDQESYSWDDEARRQRRPG